MAITNGGYAKVTKRIYWIVLRLADGCTMSTLIHESNRNTAIARAFSELIAKGDTAKVDHVEVEGDNMSAGTLEQARNELFGTPYAPVQTRSDPSMRHYY